MNMKFYCVFDTKVGAYMQPFLMQSKGAAIRGFTELVNDPNHSFGKYPEDFVLFEIGEFDDQKGVIKALTAPVSLGVGIEFKKIPTP